MKKLIIALLATYSISAHADVWECVASGDVEIKANNLIMLAKGRIGETEVTLSQYGNLLEGEIEGLPAKIFLNSQSAVGRVGKNRIGWRFNPRTGLITGYQYCILNQ